jgi:hypothetical protein
MSIVYERNQWEPGEIYYFRSSSGKTPICQVALCGDHWEVLFYRGPENRGPYRYREFGNAKAHLMQYLSSRENDLCGEVAVWGAAQAAESTGPKRDQPLVTSHPRRRRHDRHWATR